MARRNQGNAWAQDSFDTLEKVIHAIADAETYMSTLDKRLKPLAEDFQKNDYTNYNHISNIRFALERAYHLLEATAQVIDTAKDRALDASGYTEKLALGRLGR